MDGFCKNGENSDKVNLYTDGATFTMQRNFKVFARAVFALNKIGDELYLEPNREGLALRSLNCSKSAYAAFLFSLTFFSSCDVDKIRNDEYNLCRISMKPALMAFKCAKSSEKSVLMCRLFINPRADTMLVQLTHTYDIVKCHEIPLLECTTAFRNVVDKADLKDSLTASSNLLSSLLSEIRQDISDVTLNAKAEVFTLKNYVNRDQEFEKLMKTEVKVPITEFERYIVPKEAEITVNLKELKAFTVFADHLQSPLNLYFEEAGSPLVIALENDVHFTAELVVATVDNNCSIIESNPGESFPVGELDLPKEENKGLSFSKSGMNKRSLSNDKAHSYSQLSGPQSSQRLCPDLPLSGPAKRRLQTLSLQENQNLEPISSEADINYLEKIRTSSDSKRVGFREFRHYFLSSSQRTLDASQLFIDKSVIAPDSDGET